MSRRILIVDDEKFVRELIRDTLRTRGFETGLAGDGVEALEALSRDEYHLVITDVVMPRMEGLELLKRVKKKLPRLPVIVLSGFSFQHNISDFLLFGAEEYMTKPFQVNHLLSTVERVLGRGPGESGAGAAEGDSARPM
jgi:DNA-binding response OmpR family regulator